MDTDSLIKSAYLEDLPSGDITTDSLSVPSLRIKAQITAKEDLILSGSELFEKCLHYIDPEAKIEWYFKDADPIYNKQTVCLIQADNKKLLKAERVMLNFLGHLSGIASLTRSFVAATNETNCKILDTRKTTPLLRYWEKKAVKDGGAVNHRMNLSDGVMIKDNHIDIAGSIASAVKDVRNNTTKPIEVECSDLEQVKQAVALKVDRIMLDNMDATLTVQALDLIPKSIETEASGNMTVERVCEISKLGVTFISVGTITHSAPQADFSLTINKETN